MSRNDTSLDMSTLNELRDMLDDGLDELLTEYLDDTSLQLARLRAAVHSEDIAAVASISHTMKGSSGNLGVSGVYTLCQELEQAANSGAIVNVDVLLAAIEVAFETAKEKLAAYMAGSFL
jgi:HPt (histidine-containing phosphotransfer) domain-containing protein